MIHLILSSISEYGAWVGLKGSKSNGWNWVVSGGDLSRESKFWADGQPNDDSKGTACGLLGSLSLYDNLCTRLQYAICQKL